MTDGDRPPASARQAPNTTQPSQARGSALSFPGPAERSDARLTQALQQYEAALTPGRRPDRQAFLARHPEVADLLTGYLDGLDLLYAAAVQLDAPAPDRSTPQESSILGERGDSPLLTPETVVPD